MVNLKEEHHIWGSLVHEKLWYKLWYKKKARKKKRKKKDRKRKKYWHSEKRESLFSPVLICSILRRHTPKTEEKETVVDLPSQHRLYLQYSLLSFPPFQWKWAETIHYHWWIDSIGHNRVIYLSEKSQFMLRERKVNEGGRGREIVVRRGEMGCAWGSLASLVTRPGCWSLAITCHNVE